MQHAVLRIWIIFRIRDPFLSILGSGSVSYSNEHNKITGRENLTKNAFWFGPGRPTDNENQVKIYIKYSFRYITSLKRKGSGSV
jgi:hypothetical protein